MFSIAVLSMQLNPSQRKAPLPDVWDVPCFLSPSQIEAHPIPTGSSGQKNRNLLLAALRLALPLLETSTPCVFPLCDTEICLPFLGLLIRPCNISIRSNSQTIPLSNEMGFGIHDFFLIRKIPHSHHILMVAIFEKHKIISKDVVQEPI